jgi:hypothetical protein
MNNANECSGQHIKGDGSYWIDDARGIPLVRACDVCRDAKLARYRPEVLSDSNYHADEPIDGD